MNKNYFVSHCVAMMMKKVKSFGYMLKQSFLDDVNQGELIKIKYRPYQQELVQKYDEGVRFFLICWARRLGKDMFAFSIACREALDRPNGIIYYMFVTQKQGKTVLLDGYTEEGQRIIESVLDTKTLIKTKSGKLYHNDNSMRFRNGSIIYFVDSENPDTKVGGNINLLVCSEAALYRNPSINEYLIPAVLKVNGKIIKVSSPRFASQFNKEALESDNLYYKSILSAEDKRAVDENGNQVYTDELFEYNRKMMSAERYSQEILCDLEAANETSIYARSFSKDSFVPERKLTVNDIVFVSFDLGINDATSLTFSTINQRTKKLEIIYHYHNNNEPTGHYISILNDFLQAYGLTKDNLRLILPHDAKNRQDAIEYTITREEAYRQAGFYVNTINAVKVLESIEVLRSALQHLDIVFWNTPEVRAMVELIKQYEWKVNKVNGENMGIPEHGVKLSASNTCDSLEIISVSLFYDKYIKAYENQYKDMKARDYSGDWRL